MSSWGGKLGGWFLQGAVRGVSAVLAHVWLALPLARQAAQQIMRRPLGFSVREAPKAGDVRKRLCQ